MPLREAIEEATSSVRGIGEKMARLPEVSLMADMRMPNLTLFQRRKGTV